MSVFTPTQKFGARVLVQQLEPFLCDKINMLEPDSLVPLDNALGGIINSIEQENDLSYKYELSFIGDCNKVVIAESPIVQNNDLEVAEVISKLTFVTNIDDQDFILSVYSGVDKDNNIVLRKGQTVLIPSFYSWQTKNENELSCIVGNIMGRYFK